jgi:hypothetical protein
MGSLRSLQKQSRDLEKMEDALRVVAEKERERVQILDYIERLRDSLFINSADMASLLMFADSIGYKVNDGVTPKP